MWQLEEECTKTHWKVRKVIECQPCSKRRRCVVAWLGGWVAGWMGGLMFVCGRLWAQLSCASCSYVYILASLQRHRTHIRRLNDSFIHYFLLFSFLLFEYPVTVRNGTTGYAVVYPKGKLCGSPLNFVYLPFYWSVYPIICSIVLFI